MKKITTNRDINYLDPDSSKMVHSPWRALIFFGWLVEKTSSPEPCTNLFPAILATKIIGVRAIDVLNIGPYFATLSFIHSAPCSFLRAFKRLMVSPTKGKPRDPFGRFLDP